MGVEPRDPSAPVGAPFQPRIHLKTFGCKANQYDTERMRDEVEARGWRVVDDPESASVVILNTCTVTARADAEARSWVRRVRREGAQVVVAGCSPARETAPFRELGAAVHPGHDPVAVAELASTVIGARGIWPV